MSSESLHIKDLMLFLFLNINFIISQTISIEEVKNLQFNDTESEWVKNETIFNQFQSSFYTSILKDIESCKDFQLTSRIEDYQIQKLSLFSTIFENFLNHRCNPYPQNSCKLSNYWNSTTQNYIPDADLFKYLSGTSYLLFPIVVIAFIGFSLFSFLNCQFFNYCYCCCYKYKPNAKIIKTKILFIFLVILSALLLGCGMLNLLLINSGKLIVRQSFCELINNNIFKVLNGTDFLNSGKNNSQISYSSGWIGLNELTAPINFYQKSINDLNKTIFDDILVKIFKESNMSSKFNQLMDGTKEFDSYLKNESFEETDQNGLLLTDFNISYVCSECKDKIYEDFYSEVSLLINWYNYLQSFKDFLYQKLFSDLAIDNNYDISMNIKISMYKSFKFYNIVKEYQEVYNNSSDYLYYPWILLFVINFFLVLIGGFLYLYIKKKIITINQSNETILQDNQFPKQNKIKFRWVFLIIINFNMFTAFLYSIYSFTLILIAIVLYEGDIVTQNYFIANNYLNLFEKIPNGELLNNCMNSNSDKATVEDTFKIADKYAALKIFISEADEFNLTTNYYINYNFNYYSKILNSTNGLNLSNFHSKNNQSLIWDEVTDEQINYYLFPLSEYKYFKSPNETLIQYINWDFSNDNYKNYQKQWCTQATSYDVWISNQNKCKNFFPDATITNNYIDKSLDGNVYCIPITLSLTKDCNIYNQQLCYAENYDDRYSNPNDFQFCTVPEEELNSNLLEESAEYFRFKIFNLLMFAKNEEILKNNLQNKVNTLKNKFKLMIEGNFLQVVNILKEATLNIRSIMKNFSEIEKFFSNNQTISINDNENVTVTAIFESTNCSYLKTANSNLLYLVRNGISGNFFGLSILFSILALLLFFTATVIMVKYFRLRTVNELSEIQTCRNTIKALEEKELKFFFAPEDYIEAEDKEENVKKSNEVISKRSTFFKKITERMSMVSSKTKQEGELEKYDEEDQEKQAENMGKMKKWNAIKRFNFNQAKERDERLNFRNDKIDEKNE